MRPLAVAVACVVALAGCATPPADIGRAPEMSPVGQGLKSDVTPFAAYSFPASPRSSPQSLWDDDRANLFRDVRASRVGDILTVAIAMNDKAKLGNASDRTTTSKIGNGFTINPGLGTFKAAPQIDLNSTSASTGAGNVDRSEKITFQVGVVVTGVLPDGNLVISGSQEIRVNDELRIIEVGGVVRPRDISKENTIAYERIAEARISYGGRGRITEVQQPGWGQQLYDVIKPF